MSSVLTEFTIDKNWSKISDDSGEVIIIQNKSGHSVAISYTDGNIPPPAIYIGIFIIGGINDQIYTTEGKVVWAKCTLDETALITTRPYGSIDPESDLTEINSQLNSLSADYLEHKNDTTSNTHDVTKEQVGLGGFTSEFVDTLIELIDDTKQLTTKGLFAFYNYVKNHIEAKTGNVHGVTAIDVGLKNVPNHGYATDVQAVDSNFRDGLMNPATTYLALKYHLQTGSNVHPQAILSAPLGLRQVGWGDTDCDIPPMQIEATGNTTIKVNPGLCVSFASGSKTLISETLSTSRDVSLPALNGTFYIYANLTAEGKFDTFGYTDKRPASGMYRETASGDFYNISMNIMYDITNQPIRRVYIGYVNIVSGAIKEVINTPIGLKYTLPVTEVLFPSSRFILNNPFLVDCEMKVEIYYNSKWGETYWNDQIGMMVSPNSVAPTEQIVLQCGQMGFLSSGRESGSSHGANFTTVTIPQKTRIVLYKRY